MSTTTCIFDSDGLTIHREDEASHVTLRWLGECSTRDPGTKLTPFLSKLVPTLQDRSVTIDFSKLEYMNSAAVAPIMMFVKALDAHGLSIELRYSTTLGWQR